jgi:sugar (pentulose or hexulose) kinase
MMNSMRPTPVSTLHIVGGGSQNNLLNQFTADALGIEVIAGPVEATALGNILVQAIAKGELEHLDEGRQVIANSFELRHFEPADNGKWDEAYSHAKNLFS